MRKHGWQLPYHPLQVVAVAVFLALGFAFYVFFAPFAGKRMYQYIAMGIYTPLIASVFGLYIWCAAADPADPGVFRSKKYVKVPETGQLSQQKGSAKCGGSKSPFMHNENAGRADGKSLNNNAMQPNSSVQDLANTKDNTCSKSSSPLLLVCSPCACLCKSVRRGDKSSEQQMSEDGMFYCSLCEVEVFKYSKHCRVCDKCVDSFDHHCRWLNNCIGKKNYRQFFILMVSAILMLILQWSTGILVLVLCFLEGKRFSEDISSKLGSSFSVAPFVIVVGICSILAMLATLPLAQLFFFHILLIKKGISTYDYIVALREQEQEQELGGGQQSPQMSMVSSLTGLSSASSFNTFHRGAWCTPPRLFLEDQFDVVPPENASVSSHGKKTAIEETIKKKNPQVKISPWALARLNAEEVSKAAAEAKKKSRILRPVSRREQHNPFGLEKTNSFGSSGRGMLSRFNTNNTGNTYNTSKRRVSKRVRLPAELPLEPLMDIQTKVTETSTSSSALAPLQLEARSAFQTSRAMSSSGVIVTSSSSPESSLGSPDIHPFRVSSPGAEDLRRLTGLSSSVNISGKREMVMPFSRSTSDGYEASGGEDSDQVPSRNIHRLR